MPELNFEIKIEGTEELKKKFQRDYLLREPMQHLFSKAALTIERQAKIYSPVDTGRMSASITHDISGSIVPLWSRVSVPVEYASFVEYGKGKPRGRGRIPFFGPAIEKVRAKVEALLQEVARMIEERFGQ